MSSHLCRACLCDLNKSSDAVPLYESHSHKNIVYNHLLHRTFRLPLEKEQNLSTLPTNICKKCADEILQSFKFLLMYMESEKKLLKMLYKRDDDIKEDESTKIENLVTVEAKLKELKSILEPSKAAWKCDKCSAGFSSRIMLREHKRFHRSNTVKYSRCTTQKSNENIQKLWKCTHCLCEFRTKQLNDLHQQVYHKKTNASLPEPSVVINIDDDSNEANDTKDFHFADISEVNDPLDQNDFKFECSESDITTDLGLHLVAGYFDPLEANNSVGSLLCPLEVKENHSKLKNTCNDNEKWDCTICLESFRTRDMLREHKQREHKQLHRNAKPVLKEELLKNKKKDSVTVGKKRQLRNETVKAPKRLWQCQTCPKAFETRDILRIHRRIHFVKRKSSDSTEWNCDLCSAVFATRKQCVNHKQTEHESEDVNLQRVAKRKFKR